MATHVAVCRVTWAPRLLVVGLGGSSRDGILGLKIAFRGVLPWRLLVKSYWNDINGHSRPMRVHPGLDTIAV